MAAEILARCPLFSSLDGATLSGVAYTARPVEMGRNDVLFHEGDDAAALYLVLAGRIAIVKRAGGGGRESVVALMEDGDVFGEMSLFDGQGRSAQARALDSASLLEVPYPPLREAFEANPGSLWAVLALLAGRIRSTDETLADAMFLDVPGRTAKRLLELAGPAEDFGPAVTQEELAAMVGASRERVNKAIAAFVRLGWLEQADRRYRILDRACLTTEPAEPAVGRNRAGKRDASGPRCGAGRAAAARDPTGRRRRGARRRPRRPPGGWAGRGRGRSRAGPPGSGRPARREGRPAPPRPRPG